MATEADVAAVQPSSAPGIEPAPNESDSASPDDAPVCPQCGGPKTLAARRCTRCASGDSSPRPVLATAAVPEAPRRLNAFRVYCVMCGRSTEVAATSARLGRCAVCGGTQLNEDRV